ncbi:MAG: hypothetical protein QF864_13290 [SAR202 cluster bacterium]|nr:hypothetical protein [SAR202 cluster bacterium]
MKIRFRSFASILGGLCLIGISIGFILGFYIHDHFQSYVYMYASAPCLGLGSGLIIYGTLYGRNIN